jgi:hypothetical protein
MFLNVNDVHEVMNRFKHKRQRLADFKSRKSYASSSFTGSSGDWEYISIHPMANEMEWLKVYQLKPSDCDKVDCYWRIKNDVVFLQIRAKNYNHEPLGLFVRWKRDVLPSLYLDAVVEDDCISQAIIERVIEKLYRIHLSRNLFSDKRIGVKAKKIGES